MKIAIIVLLLLFTSCLSSCVSEGAGWRFNVQTAGITIEYENRVDDKGEHKFRQSFDQEGWSIIGPWINEEEGPPAPREE
jgi:hypothetical protein